MKNIINVDDELKKYIKTKTNSECRVVCVKDYEIEHDEVCAKILIATDHGTPINGFRGVIYVEAVCHPVSDETNPEVGRYSVEETQKYLEPAITLFNDIVENCMNLQDNAPRWRGTPVCYILDLKYEYKYNKTE